MMHNRGTFKMMLMLCLLASAGCAVKQPVSSASKSASDAASAPTQSASASGLNLTQCTTQVIDTGQKGSASTTTRGLYSDTKIIPGSSDSAVAYVDQSNAVLKILYTNHSKNVTEVISGDGAGAFVRLAFLSSGAPIVLWTQGTYLKAAIRSAPAGATGVWTAGIIDTGVAPRAVEISVNPLDQVAVSFINGTATSGRPKFLYCDAPCSNPAGFRTMTPNPYIENTAVIAAQTSTGIGWCKNSSTSYYPAVVYSVSGNVRYAVCQNSLAQCVSNANWVTQTVVASGNIGSKLLLDSNTTGDVPKVASKGASGVTLYKMGNTACNSAPAAFSAGPRIGTASTGTLWMTLLRDTAGLFHLVANEAATSIRYYNSTTSVITDAWNTAGIIDTVALDAAHGGGAALDTASNGLYTSYGIKASPYNLRLGRVSNITVSSNTASFSRSTPDLTGSIQRPAANSAQKNIATATTSGGNPAVAYVDYSNGASTAAKLKYAFRAGDDPSSSWEWVIIPGTMSPQYPSLAFGRNNKPWIGYFDAGPSRFYLATNSAQDGTGSWSVYEFPATPSGAPAALPAANNTAVAMKYNGDIANPVLIVIDANTVSKGVKAAVLDQDTRNWSTPVTIDGLSAGAQGAAHLSADYDLKGNVVIAYQDLTVTKLKFAHSTSDSTWSTPNTVSSLGQGVGASIKLDPVTTLPSISYLDQTNNAVLYAQCTGSLTSCETTGWTPTTAEAAIGVSGLTANTGQLLATSLLLGPSGEAYIFYPHGQTNDGHLNVSQNYNGNFTKTTLAEGKNGAVTGTAALNFAVAGWNVSSQKTSETQTTSIYIGPGNWLYATSCGT